MIGREILARDTMAPPPLKHCAFVSIDKILRRVIILIYSPDRAPKALCEIHQQRPSF